MPRISLRKTPAFAFYDTPFQDVGLPVALLETLPNTHNEARCWGVFKSPPVIIPAQVYLEALAVTSPPAFWVV